MKKILLAILCAALSVTLIGCAGQGNNLPSVDSGKTVDTKKIAEKSYENTLSGLTEYLMDQNLLSDKSDAMLSDAIGAKQGRRYHFMLDNNETMVELYEYDLDRLNQKDNPTGVRILNEVKKDKRFHLFEEGLDDDVTYNATLSSDNKGKYLVMFAGSGEKAETLRKAVDEFEARFAAKDEASQTEASAAETSKAEASGAENSKAEVSKA